VGSTVSIGRPALVRHPSVRARRRAVHEALLAAGTAEPEVVSNYELTQGSLAERRFLSLAIAANHNEIVSDRWPCESAGLGDIPGTLFRDGESAVVCSPDGVLSLVSLSWGWLRVQVASDDRAAASAMCGAFRAQFPASYLNSTEGKVPITFWTLGKFGPESRLRKIESAQWDGIEHNYTAAVRTELADLMSWDEPKRDGQLILWQGEPGTGKSWALRALASEWSKWAEFHYITDPDAFFVKDPSYMIGVLLSDSYDVIDEPTGDVYSEGDPQGKWRVLILEDTGELLAANAKESYGQGLSRLLNVVDGMIGQGLRVLALVTTNDELGTLHPAVSRPGRCASQLEFGPLSADEASAFLGETVETGGTLAELYARKAEGEAALPEQVVSMSAAAAQDVGVQIAKVAAKHQDEASGYGETAWNPDTKTVLYVCGDWTDPDPIKDDMLAIDGVDNFEHEAEALPDGWWDAQVVYPENPAKWVTERAGNAGVTDELFAEVLALAAEPIVLEDLTPPEPVQETVPSAESLIASLGDLPGVGAGTMDTDALRAALATLEAAHLSTTQGVMALVASAVQERGSAQGDILASAAIEALRQFALRPETAAAPITVNVPEQNVRVEPAQITVHVPEQTAPQVDVHVAAAEAPVVNFTVPEQAAPSVVVNVPETVVNVPPAQVEVHTHTAEVKPRQVRIQFDPVTGEKVYVQEDIDD